jgi:alkanesulfonate monooxygenase SsuD/methylene tetrahydromethanopterin reductase-like flavin-dependent oxidoreductase (luciferase family)
VTVDLAPADRASSLTELAELWEATGADHLVFADAFVPWSGTPHLGDVGTRTETTLCGTTVLVLDR